MSSPFPLKAFFCNGCRYRVEAYPDWTAQQVSEALWRGGIVRANNPHGNTPGMRGPEDIALIYAGQTMEPAKKLEEYHVPPVRPLPREPTVPCMRAHH